MDAARDGIIELCTSQMLLDEFKDVLARPKFSRRLEQKKVVRLAFVDEYTQLAKIILTKPLKTPTSRDPDDDEVLACAIAGDCEIIVTGDSDLLDLKHYRHIRILRTTELLAELYL